MINTINKTNNMMMATIKTEITIKIKIRMMFNKITMISNIKTINKINIKTNNIKKALSTLTQIKIQLKMYNLMCMMTDNINRKEMINSSKETRMKIINMIMIPD